MEHQVIHEYKLGKEMKISTIIVSVVLLSLLLSPILTFYFLSPSDVMFWWTLFVLIVCIALSGTVFIYVPRNISAGGNEIRINMLKKKRIINISDIVRLEVIDKTPLSKSIRTWGMSGFLGIAADCMNKTLGVYERYTSSNENLLLITLNSNNKIVVNCDKEKLVKYIEDYKRKY